MANLDSILNSRNITLSTMVRLAKAMIFPVVLYWCESWTIKKAEHWRIDAFELWYWRLLLRAPWIERRSNQSILKEIHPGCSLEELMLKLKPKLWPPDAKSWLIWKAPRLGKIEGRWEGDDRGWDGWMASLTQWTWFWVDSGSWWWTGRLGMLWFTGSQLVGYNWATELSWTEG